MRDLSTRDAIIEFADRLPDLFRAHVEPTSIGKVILSHEALSQLLDVSTNLPPIDVSDVNLGPAVRNVLTELDVASGQNILATELRAAIEQYQDSGACILSLGSDFAASEETEIKRALLVALSPFGLTFGAFHQRGLWQRLGVNKNAANLRAESTGEIPLHIDFDQARHPPDGVALFCVKTDPRGGGESTLFNYEGFFKALTPEDARLLADIKYSYSTLYGANGIGDVYNPHPLIDMKGHTPSFLRYNGKAVDDLPDAARILFERLEGQFSDHAAEVSLKNGDMVISDQNKTLHGRRALGDYDDTVDIPAEEDRLLYQIYLRSDCEM